MSELNGKRILVTGAAGGLGSVLVRTLVDTGAHVVAMVRQRADADAIARDDAGAGRVTALVADLSDPAEIAGEIARNIDERGPIFGVVNNAAIYPKAAVTDVDPTQIGQVLAINAVAGAVIVKACAAGMKALGGGRIVNIASNTFDTGMEELSAYVGSKGAMIGMVRVWARELGPFGITANTVSPGAFQTDAELIHPDPEQYSASVIAKQALKRRGDPREFADLVVFLLSDKAAFITGQNIRIDGGVVTQ